MTDQYGDGALPASAGSGPCVPQDTAWKEKCHA